MKNTSKILILTVGYGQGHQAAAAGLAEAFRLNGCKVMVDDPCSADTSGLYSLTKAYYRMCVRRAPWLWSMAYAQTETADWHTIVKWPVVRKATAHLEDIIVSWHPDVVVCTYPLFAYMMDFLRKKGVCRIPCAVVVTDSLEISKPWIKSDFDWLYVPDEFSRRMLIDRYGLDSSRVIDSGFPVRRDFLVTRAKSHPSVSNLRILYGVYIPKRLAVRQIMRLVEAFPQAHIVVLAGTNYRFFINHFAGYSGNLEIMDSTDRMCELLAESHIYIGKAGAATMFECYASGVPMLVNFALPGQEQGNLQLLLKDGCGCWVGDGEDISSVVSGLLSSSAAKWVRMHQNMLSMENRYSGALNIADSIAYNVLNED